MSLSTSRKLANGSGSVEKHLDGYRIYWTAPEGRRSKVLRHTSRTEATRVLNDILADIRRGDYRDERAGNVLYTTGVLAQARAPVSFLHIRTKNLLTWLNSV